MSGHTDGVFVFTDLAGFTAYTAAQGDEAALDLVERFEAEVHAVLPAAARVVKQLGDGFFLFFPDVDSALGAVVDLMGRCRSATDEGVPLWVRTGVHRGRALMRGQDLLGHDVNVASRVTGLAGAGEAVVTAPVRDEAGEGLQIDPIGPAFLKGIDEPVRLFRLVV